MTGHAGGDPVVVGIGDGLLRPRVLDRATAEARRGGGAVTLVHAHGPETPPAPWSEDAGQRAEAYLTRTAPDLEVSLVCRAGDAVALLVGSCGAGSILVLGDRHRRLASAAGHVTERAVTAAPCPVLVVPEYRGPTPPGTVVRRAVVAGVDDGPSAPAVLAHALRAAAGLGVPVEAVRVVPPPSGAETAEVPDAELVRARHELDAVVTAARRHGPEVPVSTEVVADRPARALLERAAGADELVIGHRRDGAATAREPGSTARSVLTAAPCAVAVLGPHGRAGSPRRAAVGESAP
ncbi:universal stress protein [Actinomycetospora rhizophila]|uniref:Universal stress protein n=1 Tax=Actinomycetospora rhizophila TaxID=1416876 RepID=A0ABV9ZHJ9_9PSEU